MKLKDMISFVRQNMQKNKSRVFMTTLAAAMGCAFLIVLASVGFGLHQSIISDFTEGRLVTEIHVHSKLIDEQYQRLNDQDITYLESLENVKSVTRRQRVEQGVQYYLDDYVGYGEAQVVHLPSEIEAGFELSEGRMPQEPNEIIVGYHFGANLFTTVAQEDSAAGSEEDISTEEEQPSEETTPVEEEQLSTTPSAYEEHGESLSYDGELLGQTVYLEVMQLFDGEEERLQIPLTITGIGKAPTREWMRDTKVFISEDILAEIEAFTETPLGQVVYPDYPDEQRNIQNNEKIYNEVYIYAENVEHVQGIVDTIGDENYLSYSIVNEMNQINVIFTIMKAGLILVGTIAILIASIGIYNTMTMAVTERAQDIGIMKAIGAHPSTIKRIFLIESSFIGLFGAIIGTAVAYLVSIAVNIALPLIIEGFLDATPPDNLIFSYIPISLSLLCMGISVGVAMLSGVRPARRATQMDVLQAMRRDI